MLAMLGIKQILYTFVFVSACLLLSFFSYFLQWERQFDPYDTEKGRPSDLDSQSYFYRMRYYMAKELPSFHLDAEELSMNSATQENYFLSPAGSVYDEDGNVFRYRAQKGKLLKNINELSLTGEVWINHLDSKVNANFIVYDINRDKIVATGDVLSVSENRQKLETLEIRALILTSWPKKRNALYEGGVKGKILRKRPYEEDIFFESETLSADMNKQLMILNKDVLLQKPRMKAKSVKGYIYLENYNKELKYFELFDDVSVEEKVVLDGNDSFIRKAFGEKLEGHQNSGTIILTGYPRVYQREDVIKGNRIQLRENNEVVEVDDADSNIKLR